MPASAMERSSQVEVGIAARRLTAAQQSDVSDAAARRRALIAPGGEGGIGDGQPGRVAEELDVALQRGCPQRAIRYARRAHLAVADELGFSRLDLACCP